MTKKMDLEALRSEHTPSAIKSRFDKEIEHSYLKDFIYGAVDGAVTTFAVVAGVAGAGLSMGIIIVLGLSNLIADGFSMAVSNYLGTRAEEQMREKARKMEEEHIQKIPEGEQEEVRQIFARKGFEGQMLEAIVKVITSDKERWLDVMLTEEFGLPLKQPSPLKSGLYTYIAFICVGAIPLIPFIHQWLTKTAEYEPFLVSILCTAVAFFIVGAVKSRFVYQKWIFAGLETLTVGGCAAGLAYFVGVLFKTAVVGS